MCKSLNFFILSAYFSFADRLLPERFSGGDGNALISQLNYFYLKDQVDPHLFSPQWEVEPQSHLQPSQS